MTATTYNDGASRTPTTATAVTDPAIIRAHVERILQSPPFVRAAQMQRLLTFLVEETLAGRAAQLKEYTIAVGVFGKPVDYEPGTSAAVRVEVGRLRKLLLQYRVEHASHDAIAVEVPKGSYVPVFRPLEEPAAIRNESLPPPVDPKTSPARAPALVCPEDHRLVTVLACEFGDEQGAARECASAEFLQSFDVFYSTCTGIAARAGGTVDGGSSARLVVYFGWPNALEDAAGRALTAALEMIAAVRAAFPTGTLGIRIGIATTDVVARVPLATGGAARPAVIGAAPSLAMELLQSVPLNGALVTESTRRLTGAAFELIPAGRLHPSTAPEPNLLWRLLAARQSQTRFRAAHVGSQSTIVGRREELALVLSRWRLSLEREGQGVVLSGEAGIGKSKLAETVLEQIGEAGLHLRVQCSPHHTNSTLFPFITLMKTLLGAAGTSPADEGALERFLVRCGSSERMDRALLRALLLDSDEQELQHLSASQRKDMTLKLLARVLSAQVSKCPTVLLIEDVHWADPTTVELLQELLALAANASLLALMTSRNELTHPCARQPNLTAIRLARLPKRDCSELIDGLPSAASLPVGARALILEKAEGIPLFLEELTKLFLAADERRLREPRIPESLSDLLASQLDRLGPVRGVAQLAAVIGRQFTREMLAVASGLAADEVEVALDQLQAAGIVVRHGMEATAGEFAFRHALLRDAAYGSMLDHFRRDLHSRVASLLIDSFPELAAEHPEIVARHLSEALRHEEAIAFWMEAGRKAASRYALAEAITDYRMALESLAALPTGGHAQERELEALIQLGFVIRHARGYGDEELADIYERARLLAADLGKTEHLANAVYGLWTHAAGRGRWRAALGLATEFESLARDMDDDGQGQVEASRLLGASAAFRGEFAIARCHFERVLASYDPRIHGARFGFDPGAASAAYFSWTAWHLGQREEAKVFAAKALTIAREKGHPSTLAMTLSWLMFYEVCEHGTDAILRYNDHLQSVCAERDCRYWQPFGSACAEWAAFQSDRDSRHLERLLEHTKQFREQYLTSCLLLLGAEMCRDLRRPDQGLELTQVAQQFIEEHDERVWEAECSRHTVELLLLRPDVDARRVRSLLARALQTSRRQGARALEQRAAETLAAFERRAQPLPRT